MQEQSPITTLDISDPGDDVIARFRYQFCNVAINALRLVSQPSWAKSVICENYEDLILERKENELIAIQVKTRARHLTHFKLTDDAVEKSLVRFVKLNKQFPTKFIEFRFTTNHEMWRRDENENNLPWLLSEIEKAPTIKNLRKRNPKKIAILRLCEACDAEPEEVIEVLSITKCSERKEDIKSIEMAVVDAVVECEQCAHLPHKTVLKIAHDVIAAAGSASAKGSSDFAPILYAIDADFSELFSEITLMGKKIDRQIVEDLVSDRLEPSDEPLAIADMIPPDNLPPDLARMVQKMGEGGVETARINHTHDLVRSFESLKIKWTLRHGPSKTREMVSDLLSRTMTECVEAQAEAAKSGPIYGSLQFSNLKKLLDDRYVREKDSLYGCKPDHLLGAAGILTQECRVWWSEVFDLMDESQ